MMLYTSIFGLGVNFLMVLAIHYDHFIGNKLEGGYGHCHGHNHSHSDKNKQSHKE